jgi:hypothetical protein
MGAGTLALDLLTHDHIRVHSVAGTDFVSVATHGIHAHPVGSELNRLPRQIPQLSLSQKSSLSLLSLSKRGIEAEGVSKAKNFFGLPFPRTPNPFALHTFSYPVGTSNALQVIYW